MIKRNLKRMTERSISEIAELNCKVYVFLEDEEIGKRFLADAEKEGFTFGDGVKPTERHVSDIFALHKDKTLCYLGWAGHIVYAQAEKVGDQTVIRVDYKKYVNGEDFIIDM